MAETPEVTIVGGGVIGCAAAWWLTARGARVEVLEAEEPGAGASGASAGVLGPLSDSIAPGFMTAFALDALREIDARAEAVAEASGIDIGYRRSGVLRVARTDVGLAALDGFVARRDGLGLHLQRLDPAQLRTIEPRLSPTVRAGVYCQEETHVLPGALTRALAEAARRGGARFRTGTRVTAVERNGDAVTALRTTTERIPVAALVVAAGTGAAALGEMLGTPLPVHPVRGGMAAFRPDPPFAEAPIFAEDVLLVPKPDGELWVGATHDDGNDDPRPTAGDLAALLPEAIAVAPGLARAAFLRAWAGLRPATPDGLPALGPLPGLRNAYAAVGFYRNGILLSMLAGRVIAGVILDNAPGRDIAPLDPARFLR
jgi:glycine oxidase